MTEPVGLYHSPLELPPWQPAGAGFAYTRPTTLAIWSQGTGKQHLAMMLSAVLHEDGLVDRTVVTCEAGKVDDVVLEEFGRFTGLEVGEWSGRAGGEHPQVVVVSYEKARADICEFKPSSRAVLRDGPLTEFLADQRVLLVLDEPQRLGKRSSGLHRTQNHLINGVLRRRRLPGVHTRVLGMTATTVTTGPTSHYNVGRILAPELVGTVADFERDHVRSWSPFRQGQPESYKNLSPTDDVRDPDVVPLSAKLAPIVHRVRKTDPEVARYFPTFDEQPPTIVQLSDAHMEFVQAIYEEFADRGPDEDGALWNAVRMAVDYPVALLRADGRIARHIVAEVGEEGLRRIGSRKVEAMLAWASGCLGGPGGGRQGVAFTFYGNTVLPFLAEDLRAAGYAVSVNVGTGMTRPQRRRSKQAFLRGDTQIFLSSDAGARGLNLGPASALLHVEPPTKYEVFTQRSDRIHRFDSPHARVRVDMLAAARTVDMGSLGKMLERNEQHEALVDADLVTEGRDPGVAYLSAEERRRILAMSRRLAA